MQLLVNISASRIFSMCLSVFFFFFFPLWRNFAKFRPQKCYFNQYEGFLIEKKMAQIRQILKEKKFQIARFL